MTPTDPKIARGDLLVIFYAHQAYFNPLNWLGLGSDDPFEDLGPVSTAAFKGLGLDAVMPFQGSRPCPRPWPEP